MEAEADACNGWLNEAVFLAASVRFSWPPVFSFLAATVQVLMAADTWDYLRRLAERRGLSVEQLAAQEMNRIGRA